MEGCLTTLVKLLILGGLFCFGLVVGYLYHQGLFDAPLVDYSFDHLEKIAPEGLAKRIDERATVELASRDFGQVDRRWVSWKGLYSDTRLLSSTLSVLTVRTDATPRRTFVAFYDRPLANAGIHLGDTIEVVGQVRKLWVNSEDRDGRPFPQILAVGVRKVTPKQEAAPPSPEPVTRVTKEIKD